MRVIHREELQRLLRKGGLQLVEVLPEEEFAESHIPGAINLPLSHLTPERAREALDISCPVAVYCQDEL